MIRYLINVYDCIVPSNTICMQIIHVLDQFIPYLAQFYIERSSYQIEGAPRNWLYIICNMYNEQPKKDLTISVILGVQPHSDTYMAKHSSSSSSFSSFSYPPPPPDSYHPPPAPPTPIPGSLMKRRNLIIKEDGRLISSFFLVMCRDFFPHISIQSKCLVQNQFSRSALVTNFIGHELDYV